MARVERLLILIGSIEASKYPIKKALNSLLFCSVGCKRLSILLNAIVGEHRVPL
jgi:hypothetical protein